MLPPRKSTPDTLFFASRFCKLVILLVTLLIGGTSLYLWWLGRPHQGVMSAFIPLLMPALVLVLAFNTFRTLARTRRQALVRQFCIPVALPYQFWQAAGLCRQAFELGEVSGSVLFPWRSHACLIPRFIWMYPRLPQG